MDKFRIGIMIAYISTFVLVCVLNKKIAGEFNEWGQELDKEIQRNYEKLRLEGLVNYYMDLTYSEIEGEYGNLLKERESYNLGYSTFSKKDKKLLKKYIEDEARFYEKENIAVVSEIEAKIKIIEELLSNY